MPWEFKSCLDQLAYGKLFSLYVILLKVSFQARTYCMWNLKKPNSQKHRVVIPRSWGWGWKWADISQRYKLPVITLTNLGI